DNTEAQFYTISDLIDLLPLGRNTIYRLVNKDDFPKVRIGKKFIIPAHKLNEWLEINIGSEISLNEVEKFYEK
ncbi:helix-turn-helix domain-containing protein, partial [Paenibacillus sp. HN-1]